jgi:hypothetical protein
MGEITTWANGFGIWHVRVSRTAAGPLIAARRGLRDELQQRESRPIEREIWMHPIRVPELDDEATIVYRERLLDEDPEPDADVDVDPGQPWEDPKVREAVLAALRANGEREHFADYEGRDECPAYGPLVDRKIAPGSDEERDLCTCGKVLAFDALALITPSAETRNTTP